MRITSIATTLPAPLSVAPVADDPAIQVAADHHDFVFELRIGAGNFGDGVKAVLVVAIEFRFDVELDGYGHVGFQQPVDTAVVFNRGHRQRNGIRVVLLINKPPERGAVVVKDCAARAAAIRGIAAGQNHRSTAPRRETGPTSRGIPRAA